MSMRYSCFNMRIEKGGGGSINDMQLGSIDWLVRREQSLRRLLKPARLISYFSTYAFNILLRVKRLYVM